MMNEMLENAGTIELETETLAPQANVTDAWMVQDIKWLSYEDEELFYIEQEHTRLYMREHEIADHPEIQLVTFALVGRIFRDHATGRCIWYESGSAIIKQTELVFEEYREMKSTCNPPVGYI